MSVKTIPFPRWATASIADAADSAPMDIEHLGTHYNACSRQSDRWFRFRCAADAVHDFLAPRMVTTVCVATLAIAVVAAIA